MPGVSASLEAAVLFPVAGHSPSSTAGLCPPLLPYPPPPPPRVCLLSVTSSKESCLEQRAIRGLILPLPRGPGRLSRPRAGSPWSRPHCPPSALQPCQLPVSTAPWAPRDRLAQTDCLQHARVPPPSAWVWLVGGSGRRGRGRAGSVHSPSPRLRWAQPLLLAGPALPTRFLPCLVNCLNNPPGISPPECLLSGPSGAEGSQSTCSDGPACWSRPTCAFLVGFRRLQGKAGAARHSDPGREHGVPALGPRTHD